MVGALSHVLILLSKKKDFITHSILHVMLKKRSIDKTSLCAGRAVQCLFLSKAGPKKVCSAYLIAIIRKQTLDIYNLALISDRYDKHPFFWSGVYENQTFNYTTKPVFFAQKSVHLFFSIMFL